MNKVFYCLAIMCLVLSVFTHAETKNLLIIDSQSQEPYKTLRETMIRELADSGFKEGATLNIDYEVLGNIAGRGLSVLKSKTSEKKYDVIFLNGTVAGQSAMEFLKESGINSGLNFIFGNITDPVGLGMLKTLGKPSDSMFTGISYPVNVAERIRFVTKIFGKNVKIGYIYADMPQSHSYNKWIEEALKNPEFKDVKFIFEKVEFVKSDGGHKRMVKLAENIVKVIDDKVDVYMSPNDQLGSAKEFAEMIYTSSKKPLVGLAIEKGAAVSYGPDLVKNGKKIGQMIKSVFEGKKISEIIPQNSESNIYIDNDIVKKFGIKIPNL